MKITYRYAGNNGYIGDLASPKLREIGYNIDDQRAEFNRERPQAFVVESELGTFEMVWDSERETAYASHNGQVWEVNCYRQQALTFDEALAEVVQWLRLGLGVVA